MRNAYALLGLAFIIVFGGAYILVERAEAPTPEDAPVSTNDTIPMSLTLTSPVFTNNGMIPSEYTCDGANTMPPLEISGVPEGTVSLVLVMDDPDIPTAVKERMGIEKFDHFAVYNLSPDTHTLTADNLSGTLGLNGRGEAVYTGPCPPPEYEPTEHRYIFRLYALSGHLNFIKAPTLDELETAASGMAIANAELTGRYQRITAQN
ncbi:YbhB/YbcL family Raf kinase inhibitor-like protein [Candidatus Kaiserbacteria bacterium]|nr:YbhB/YbcL family Raf kinase inhibitor-like protein [Candidatus Kaiserbacteria bacterium]MCB9811972.1 YbhB/YbcL family Raf kinase inhibitor-like protein [Candidatus Nomurabacteria bacterium]